MADSYQISVIVPESPFAKDRVNDQHCLCAINVEQLMTWWPGDPHSPHRNAAKVTAIQRSLDWKRVAQIAAYLLQSEIKDVPEKLNKYFSKIYEPKKNEPGRQWPPKVNKVIGFTKSVFPTFSNVLIHVNGASILKLSIGDKEDGAAKLIFDVQDAKLNFSVIDGQHRINGAYLAICILKETNPHTKWEIPADIFLDLDPAEGPPTKQAQIFIDVNFYQKKVDKSLVADLFPTARGKRDSIDKKERAQDIGRKLMLETGPLVGMIQIPGIKYGVKDVITLSTLNGAIENVLEDMEHHKISSLEMQTEFLAQILTAWFNATGKFQPKKKSEVVELDEENFVYQGRVLVSVLTLVPALIIKVKSNKIKFVSDAAQDLVTETLIDISKKSGLLIRGEFMSKDDFKNKGYLGSGGIGRFRDSLWAALDSKTKISDLEDTKIAELANMNRQIVNEELKRTT